MLDYIIVGIGLMVFDKVVLVDWWKFVDLDVDCIGNIFDDVVRVGYVMWGFVLKCVLLFYLVDYLNVVFLW